VDDSKISPKMLALVLETAVDKLEARIARAVKPYALRPMPELVPA
jgi:hypothetical protein